MWEQVQSRGTQLPKVEAAFVAVEPPLPSVELNMQPLIASDSALRREMAG